MSKPDSNSQSDKSPERPTPIRLAPSRNQKQRSKLKQAPEESIAEEPVPEPPPPEPKVAPELVRRTRLKRSGQMHEDLTGPMPPPATSRDEPEY